MIEAHNEAQGFLLAHLELVRDLRRSHYDTVPHGYHYWGMEDFLLQHGVWYEPRPLPSSYPAGAERACFANALVISAMRRGHRYIEGYALTCFGFPTHHGWNVDTQGNFIDNTWRPIGDAYLGVEFSIERAADAICNGDANVLSDWRRDYPIYQNEWRGETPNAIWPPCPVLDLIREGKHAAAIAWAQNEISR